MRFRLFKNACSALRSTELLRTVRENCQNIHKRAALPFSCGLHIKNNFSSSSHQGENGNFMQTELKGLLEEEVLEDEQTKDIDDYLALRDHYIHVLNATPQVLLIQPFVRNYDKNAQSNPQLMLQESVALVKTLDWKIVDAVVVGLNTTRSPALFGSGKMKEIVEKVNSDARITSIFISIYKLSFVQRVELENIFQVPIIDRYSLVLQIFYQHARSNEAKLQVTLGELPYLRHRLNTEYYVEQNSKGIKGNLGEQVFQTRNFSLNKFEQKIKKKIGKIKNQRQKLRQSNSRTKFPTVAIVGYTNCGKTTLIRTLTGDNSLQPENKLFATLDVTTHQGYLPQSNLPCLFIDTVGFISDIPTQLIASFSATLEDALHADLVVHVRDLSHPDAVNQNSQVLATFQKLKFQMTEANSLTVANKIDKVKNVEMIKEAKVNGEIPISATMNVGLSQLQNQIEEKIIRIRGLHRSIIKVRTGSEMMNWLKSNVTVVSMEVFQADPNFTCITVLWNEEMEAKFKHNFVKI